jgi:hypothetical protein
VAGADSERVRIVLLAVLLALALPAIADAARMPAPAGVVAHDYANPECGGYPCANPFTGEVWLPAGTDRYERAHEIGHIWFATVPTDEQREWFIRKLRLPVTGDGGDLTEGAWYRGTGDDGHDSPDERAADAYAMCDLGRSPAGRVGKDGMVRGEWETSYSYLPSARQHRRICNAIAVTAYYASGTAR